MGAAAIIGSALGLYSMNKQRQAANEATQAAVEAQKEATKTKARDIVQATESKSVEAPVLGSANRQVKRRGKSALTIDRTPAPGASIGTGTGLQI